MPLLLGVGCLLDGFGVGDRWSGCCCILVWRMKRRKAIEVDDVEFGYDTGI